MATGVNVWSKTAATNNTADSAVNWQEGQAPSSVNDSARGMMAATAKWRDDLNGSLVTGGTTTAYTLTTNQSFAALAAGLQVGFQINATNTGTTTLAVDGLTAKPLRSAAGVELLAGSLLIGAVYRATYFTSNSGEWIVESYPVLGDLQVGTAKIAASAVTTAKINDAAVTLAKMESRTQNTLVGRYTASTGAPQEVTVGAGLLLNTSTGNLTSAFPAGAFKSLVIKVTGNTGLTAMADFVSTTDGTTWQTTALSSTINMATTGANALDTGSIASATWYAIWAIAKADGTTAGLASTSFTSPTMPSGYTFKARIGAVRTASGSAQLLGTWQFGRRAQYVVGLAQSSALPILSTGSTGNISTPTWTSFSVTGVVPSTASQIKVVVSNAGVANVISMAAPSNSYGAATSTTNPPPIIAGASSSPAIQGYVAISADIMLESTNIYYASAGGLLAVFGWEDNI